MFSESATDLEVYVALHGVGLCEQFGIARLLGDFDALSEAASAAASATSDFSWDEIACGIIDYPALGLQELATVRAMPGAKALFGAIQPLVENLRSATSEADLRSQSATAKWSRRRLVEVPYTNFWSSMPAMSLLSVRVVGANALWDDFMTPQADDVEVEDLAPESLGRILELRSIADWQRLTAQHSQIRMFASAPNPALNGRFLVPDWEGVSREYDSVFLSLECYLQAAYRPIDVPSSQLKTMLAGWHPASIVTFAKND